MLTSSKPSAALSLVHAVVEPLRCPHNNMMVRIFTSYFLFPVCLWTWVLPLPRQRCGSDWEFLYSCNSVLQSVDWLRFHLHWIVTGRPCGNYIGQFSLGFFQETFDSQRLTLLCFCSAAANTPPPCSICPLGIDLFVMCFSWEFWVFSHSHNLNVSHCSK